MGLTQRVVLSLKTERRIHWITFSTLKCIILCKLIVIILFTAMIVASLTDRW